MYTNTMYEFNQKTPIEIGISGHKKYCVVDKDDIKRFLRITPQDESQRRKVFLDQLKKVSDNDIPMCRLLDYNVHTDGVYELYNWIDGVNLEDVLRKKTKKQRYELGVKSGNILRKIHSIKLDDHTTIQNWKIRYSNEIDIRLNAYRKLDERFNGSEYIFNYIDKNYHLLINRPQCFHHGDYHEGNIMIHNNELFIIDWDYADFNNYGDPWVEFNRIVWSAKKYPHYAAGQIKGYFDGNPPEEFWNLFAFYLSASTITSILWATRFGEKEKQSMIHLNKTLLKWFDNMQNPVPTWYKNL